MPKLFKLGESGEMPLPDLLRLIRMGYPKLETLGNDPYGTHYRDLP